MYFRWIANSKSLRCCPPVWKEVDVIESYFLALLIIIIVSSNFFLSTIGYS